jgi:hypothetical protein
MIQRGPFVKGKPRKRNRDGTWRKKRSDAGKKREKTMGNNEPLTEKEMIDVAEEDKLVQRILNIAYYAIDASSKAFFWHKKAIIYMKALGDIIDLCIEQRNKLLKGQEQDDSIGDILVRELRGKIDVPIVRVYFPKEQEP